MASLRIVIAVAALALLARGARAQDTAKAHYDRGVTAFALGHFAEAADEYEKAFALKPDLALLYDAAQSHRHAGNKERALLLYQNCLAIFGTQLPNADEIKRHIAELRQSIDTERAARSSQLLSPGPAEAPASRAHRRRWVWGVVAGSVAAVGIGLGVGLGVGLSGRAPTPTFGSLTVQ